MTATDSSVKSTDPSDPAPTTPGTPPVDADGDGWAPLEDCDDGNPAVHPDAEEWCNGLDDDCDGQTDEDGVDALTWFVDGDLDGYGAAGSQAVVACDRPIGYSSNNLDCDDTTAAVSPARDEACNAIDDDCDPATSEDGVVTRAWIDPLGGPPDPIQSYTVANFSPLQSAVDDLEPGQVIVLCPGTYRGFQVWDDSATYANEWPTGLDAIVLEGLYGAEVTLIEDDALGPVDAAVQLGPYFVEGESPSLTLRGLSITDDHGSAVRVEVHHPVITIEDCVLADNHETALWWHSSASSPTVDLVRTRFERNFGIEGGAIGFDRGFPTITGIDLEFVDNAAWLVGGAVEVGAGSFTCTGCVFEGNEVTTDLPGNAGGSAIYAESGTVALDSSRLAGNVGSAAIKSYVGVVDLADTELTGNEAGEGGALYLYWGASATIAGGSISGNDASEAGGAIFFRAAEGATLTADGVDFGANPPEDVVVFQSGGGSLSFDYEGVVSFSCDSLGCSEP